MLAACSVLTVLLLAVPAQAAFPGANGKIAFEQSEDIWSANPDGTGATDLTNTPNSIDRGASWSPDGTRIAFSSNRDGNFEIYVMNADGSGQVRLTVDPLYDIEPAWSPDGATIVFAREGHIWRMGADGSSPAQLTTGPLTDSEPAWSPSGAYIAFSRFDSAVASNIDVYRMNADGSGVTRLTTTTQQDTSPDWAPDELLLVYRAGQNVATIRPDGTGSQIVPNTFRHQEPVWSPENYHFAMRVTAGTDIVTMNEIGTERVVVTPGTAFGLGPSWQPLQPPPPPPPGYPRPKGATPVSTSLVPAYRPCESPDREHGPPLAFASCSGPAQASDYLTVGTADSNARPTKFMGSIALETIVGNPSLPGDQADLQLRADIADVLCAVNVPGSCTGVLSDYGGQLEAVFGVRITDKLNGHAGTLPGTAEDLFRFPFTIPCVATADTTTGGACSLSTTADALVPGTIVEGKRAIWEIGQIRVNDGGADGEASSDDNTPFLTQGIFVP
jgi:hypothetical protein